MVASLFSIIAASLVIERVVEQIAEFIPRKRRKRITWIISTIIALLFTFGAKAGIFQELGLLKEGYPWVPYLDYFLTGLLIGGGTEPVHSVVHGLEKKKEELKYRAERGKKDAS